MKERLVILTILFVTSVLLPCQSWNLPQDNGPQTHVQRNNITITGCLAKNKYDDYELVDQKGIHNLIYGSDKFDLESYVGRSVTLIGERGAISSADTGTARLMPHFKVADLRPASGKCSK